MTYLATFLVLPAFATGFAMFSSSCTMGITTNRIHGFLQGSSEMARNCCCRRPSRVGTVTTRRRLAYCWKYSPRPSTLSATTGDDFLVPVPADKMTASASIPRVLSFEEGRRVMDDLLLPASGYGDRIEVGRDAQGLALGGTAVSPNDPRMFLTYGEFPLSSLDELLDLALSHYQVRTPSSMIHMVDVGSGCARLALYAALTRGGDQSLSSWHVHGIEISPVLHHEAVQALTRAWHGGYVQDDAADESSSTSPPNEENVISLHAGAAQEWTEVLSKCNIVFAYSTAWPTNGFSEQVGAMIIGQEWSGLLAKSCPNGCVAITTDRALDPGYGWELVDRLNVENREVMGSTGYIHVLRR